MVMLSLLHADLHSEHAGTIKTCFLVTGMKDVSNEIVFELVFLVLEVNLCGLVLATRFNDLEFWIVFLARWFDTNLGACTAAQLILHP